MVAQNIFFYVIAAGMVGAAVAVVTTPNVVHAVLLAAVMGYALIDRWGDDALPAERQVNAVGGSNTATVSDSIFSQYLIPFEIVSVLLLAALVGAIVIARKDR